jgi:signal transduction histidine kinase
MLRGTPSLALRASLIFMSVYAAILLAVVGVSAAFSWADRGAGNLRGAVIAVDYAAAELRESGGRLLLRSDGRFADLAARNPTLWLIAIKDGRTFTTGAVGNSALETVRQLRSATDSVMFRLAGQEMPLAAGKLQRLDLTFGSVILAAGGVDPATLSTRESVHLLLEPEVALLLATIAVISLLAMFVAVPAFARALRPITIEAAAIGPADPGRRLGEQKAPKELLPLVRGFNAALDRLEVELGRRKRFIADVAHELRTPLAVVSLQAESLADGGGKADLQRGLRRLTNLVAQMLDLERLALSGRQGMRLDLVAVSCDVVAELAPLAIRSGYDLSLDAPDAPILVTGDAHAIARAITNLIGNAMAHGGGAGSIRVRVAASRTIDVQDEGPGVPIDLQPILFEPFTRGSSDGEGCGLGLHLTREIMRAHGGEICLLPNSRETIFRLTFPPPRPDRCG